MSNIKNTFINALLADAAYADGLSNNLSVVDLFDALKPRMTPTLASFISNNFEVVSHQEKGDLTESGFDATVWRGRAGTTYTGQIYVSMQGTLGAQDFLTDANLASPFGIARSQIVDMVNWWNQITTATDQSAKQIRQVAPIDGSGLPFFAAAETATGTGLLLNPGAVQVTGHSLGGHLAAAFARLMGDRPAGNGNGGVAINNVTTFNSAGFAPGSEAAFTELQNAIGIGAASLKSNKQTNVFAQNGVNVTTNSLYFNQVGKRVALFNEQSTFAGTSVPNHYMYKLTDALALGAAFEKLDATFTLDHLNTLLSAGASEMPKSLESILDALRRVVAGTDAVSTQSGDASDSAPSRVDYHQKLTDVQEHSAFKSAAQAGTARIRDLTAVSASTIARTATSGAEALAYRYALKELNPFAITGLDYNSLHNSGDKQGALELFKPADGTGQLTEEYLKDRAEFLSGLIKANIQDAVSIRGANTNTNKLYVDVSANTVVAVKGQVLGFDSTEAAAQYRFGGTGNDTLTGNQTGGGDIEHEQGDRVIRNKACKAMQSKKRRTPIGGHRGTKKARTARGTETLRFDKSTAQRRTKYTAANNNQYVRAA